MNNDKPLGLPKGSVRALLALGIAFSAIYVYITKDAIPEGLITLAGAVIAFYFGTKSGSEKPES